MKNILLPSLLLASVLGASTLSAQTTWTGADGASLTTASNWTPATLPTGANTGTINSGTLGINFNSSITEYNVIQNGGNVTATGFRQLNTGSWTMNGGSMTVPTNLQLTTIDNTNQVLTINSGATLNATGTTQVSSTGTGRTSTMTISGGTVNHTGIFNVNQGGTVNFTSGLMAASQTLNITAGGAFNMSGGTRNGTVNSVTNSGTLLISGGSFSTASDRTITTNAGATTTISGGTVSVGSAIGSSLSGAGAYVFNGGTTTASGFINPSATGFSLTLGGTAAGSLTATNWSAAAAANRNINWLSGTKMEMTLSLAATWAETEWTANRMFFNGSSGSTLGLTWAQVIDPLVGFDSGGGTYFDWDGGTRTLALVPEPSTWALLAVGMTAAVIFRRRRQL